MTEDAKPEPTAPSKKSAGVYAWVGSTYFAEGLPYSIVRILSSIYFTDIGIKENIIGYLNFLGLPWNFKFLWAPFVDALGTKRRWMIVVQFLIALFTAGLAATAAFAERGGDATVVLLTFVAILWAMAFLSATNDIAIDGYYMEALNKSDQAGYSGYRILAYRLSVIFVRSVLVALAAYMAQTAAGENKQLGWIYAFAAAALTLFLLALFHVMKLARIESADHKPKKPMEVVRSYGASFRSYLKQEKVGLVLLFICTYKLGDEILFSMNSPFLMRELSVTKAQIAWLGFVSMACAIAGAMLGGWWIKKVGIKKAIWPMTLLMNFTIWAYWWLAVSKPDPTTDAGVATIAAIHGYEFFAAGLGNAALVVFLMRTCHADHKASHFAIGSAIMSLGGTVMGGFGGDIVEAIGYVNLYALAFSASIPAMIILFFVPLKEDA